MPLNSVGIVGYGAFGTHLEELFRALLPDVSVKIFSKRFQPDGLKFFSLEDTVSADLVLLCGPIAEYESQIEAIKPLLNTSTVVVDVATVKTYTNSLFKKHFSNQPYICAHPMFGPESYKKTNGDVSGFRIVITEHNLDDSIYLVWKDWLARCGFVVIEMTADQHDKLLAETLFLTHYIGQTMKQAGFARTNIDTVSFQSLMNAVESVAHDEKLFMDVYKYNPYCKEAARRFHEAQETVFNKVKEIE